MSHWELQPSDATTVDDSDDDDDLDAYLSKPTPRKFSACDYSAGPVLTSRRNQTDSSTKSDHPTDYASY